MRHQFTAGQIRMLVDRAERQLEQIIAGSVKQEPASKNIARSSHVALHETVVSLIRLFRDQLPGAASVATQIAREYAKGVDAKTGAPTLACVRTIASLVREARARHLSPELEMGQVSTSPFPSSV
ncbi:MAG: hypothetical protein ACJ8LG_23615 [Massilia sp.]